MTDKGRTTRANAPHAAMGIVDKIRRYSRKIGIGFQRKPRPFSRI